MDFTERFKEYSDSELLKIIDNPDDFQPLAVETARSLFASRQLSTEDIEFARQELIRLKREKEIQNEKKKVLENKVKALGYSLIENFNPIGTTTPSTDKTIKTISLIFAACFFYQLFNEYEMLKFMFTDPDAIWDFSMLIYFLPLLIIPLATFMFYTHKKNGWTLMTIYLTYSLTIVIHSICTDLTRQHYDIAALDSMLPRTSPVIPIITLLFFAGLLGVMCKENIRKTYSIEKKFMITSICVTAIIVESLLLSAF